MPVLSVASGWRISNSPSGTCGGGAVASAAPRRPASPSASAAPRARDADQYDEARKGSRQPQAWKSSAVSTRPEQQEQPVGGDEADRRAPSCGNMPGTPRQPGGALLDRQQRCPAPLAAEPEALAEAQQAEAPGATHPAIVA